MEFNTWRVNEPLLAEFKRVRNEVQIDWSNYESKCKPKVQSTVKGYKFKPLTQALWFAKLVETLKVKKN